MQGVCLLCIILHYEAFDYIEGQNTEHLSRMHKAGEECRKKHAAIETPLTKPQQAHGATPGRSLV